MNLAMCEVPVHPVEHLTEADIASLPELPMTQSADGTWYCDGESTQFTQEQGKNVFDGIVREKDGLYDVDGNFTDNTNYDVYYLRKRGSEPTYTDSQYIGGIKVFFDSSGNFVSGIHIIDTKTYSFPENAVLCKFAVAKTNQDKENQIEVGTKATPYEPFRPKMPSPDYQSPITNTYPAGTYKAICGDKVYKVVLDDDLRSVPGTADRVTIDAGRGKLKIEKGIGYIESYTDETVETVYMSSTGELTEGATVIYQLSTPTTHQSIPTQLITIQSGRSAQILGTVNDKADFLKVQGDSWQLVQDEIKDADGNVTQPKMPSPEYQSEIKDVDGVLRSCGWNYYSGSDIEGTQNNNSGTIQTIPPGKYTFMADVESSDTDNTKCFILFYNGTTMLNGVIIGRGKGAQTTVTISDNVTKFTCYASNTSLNSLGDTFSFKNIQITQGTTTKPYDRHRGNSITLPTLRGLPDGTRDVLYVDRKAKRAWVERFVGHIESYNGESVGDVFMSSTGELSTGAVVHYKLATPVIEELPDSDYLLEMSQWETNLFVDCDENLVPEIEVGCKVLGR